MWSFSGNKVWEEIVHLGVQEKEQKDLQRGRAGCLCVNVIWSREKKVQREEVSESLSESEFLF